MQFINLKTQQEKINDIRFVIASAAKRSIHMVLDCRSRIRSFAMTVFSDCRSCIRFFAMTFVYPLKCVFNLINK